MLHFFIKRAVICNNIIPCTTNMGMNDEYLILEIKKGNRQAFRYLVDKYNNLVWHLILRMVNQHEDAEDLSQEVFLRVYRDIHKFRGESKLSTWIGSIAYNAATDYLRKRGRKQKVMVDYNDIIPDIRTDDIATPLEELSREDTKKMIHVIIERMPVQFRTVITLYHLEQFSYAEITEVTGMPEGTVKSYISRGRTFIKEKLVTMIPGLQKDYAGNL